MSRYGLNKALWTYARDPDFKAAFDRDATAATADRELSADERAARAAKDVRAIFKLGAHPFLLYSFSIAANGGWSMDMMKDYVSKLEGLELGDIET